MQENYKRVKIAIFDVCSSYVYFNTTFRFIEFVAKNDGELRKYLFKNIYFLRKIRFYRIFGDLLYRKHMIRLLKGFCKSDLYKLASDFVNDEMIFNINIKVDRIFKELKLKGYKCILLSAAISPPIIYFAEKVKADRYFASELTFDKNNIVKGKLGTDLLNDKKNVLVKQVQPLYGEIDFGKSYCITDNIEDLGLLEMFGNPMVVLHKGNRDFWNEHHFPIVR